MFRELLLLTLLGCGALGCLFMVVAARVVRAFVRRQPMGEPAWPAVTILKPLHGEEPELLANLASFCGQDYPAPVQIVFGVASAADPAIAAVRQLQGLFPKHALDLVIDARIAGSNPKVANLVNMSGRIAHDIVVLADSDIRVAPDYLKQIVSALEHTGGAVSCPYYGISTGELWSNLSRMNIDGHFLPGVMVGARFKLSRPCLGSTIAFRRRTLAAIGGFEAVCDCLADDYALGEAFAKHGEPVAVLPMAVGHVCGETSFAELWRHELRWALTIRSIDPIGYLGWGIGHALPLAVIALLLGGGLPALSIALAALACRAALLIAVVRSLGLPPHSYWLIPLRDLLSFAVFLAGFVARDVSWRGHRYRLMSEGSLISERRSPSS